MWLFLGKNNSISLSALSIDFEQWTPLKKLKYYVNNKSKRIKCAFREHLLIHDVEKKILLKIIWN